KPCHPGDDHQLPTVAAQLRAPVGEPRHLTAQPDQRLPQLLAVLLDRGADLIGSAGGHQLPPSEDPAATVSRIFLASSIAIFGVGGPTLSLRQANIPAPTVSASRSPNT